MIAFSDNGVKNLDMFGHIDGTRGTVLERGEWIVFKVEQCSAAHVDSSMLRCGMKEVLVRKGFRSSPLNPKKRMPGKKGKHR